MGAIMRVIVVGGSIAGTACAHALLKIGCEVIVFERATSVTAAGAVREHPLVGWEIIMHKSYTVLVQAWQLY